MSEIHESVKNYYGKELSQSNDLKTNACCTLNAPPKHIAEALSLVHEEVQAKYYGCGLTLPSEVAGLRILDLGSGSGRDCYIASKLVGETGEVVGVDMTDEQLDVAKKHMDYHAKQFNYKKSNVTFIKGNIEKLDELPLEPNSFDLIISNCVINLVGDKNKVLKDAYNLLKPGGEMYFSDVYSDRRVPKKLQEDRILWGECLSGALYWNDFLQASNKAGFIDLRPTESKPITIENAELESKVGLITFFSVTFRLFKIEGLESDCEDYGQAVKYNGTIESHPHAFDLDNHHHFPKDRIISVCGNTYKMLHDTRFNKHFEFYGDGATHHGIFEGCGSEMPFENGKEEVVDKNSCC